MPRERQPARRMRSFPHRRQPAIVRERVPEAVRVDVTEARGERAIAHRLIDAVRCHRPGMTQPERRTFGFAVLGAHAQVTIERHRGPPTEGAGARSSALAHHHSHVVLEVDVGNRRPASSERRIPYPAGVG